MPKEYIDKEAFCLMLYNRGNRLLDEDKEPVLAATLHAVEKMAHDFPAVDAVPVVRCGDCQNWETDWEPSPFNPDNPQHYCAVNDLFPNGDWFCKDGQRREDGDENG